MGVHITDSDSGIGRVFERAVDPLAAAVARGTAATDCDEVAVTRLLAVAWAGRVSVSARPHFADDKETEGGKGSS